MEKLRKYLNKEFKSQIPVWIEDSLNNIPIEWEKILFKKNCRKKLFKIYSHIQNTLDDPEENLSPDSKYIFNFAKLTPLDKINIVIIGQDPYPNKNHAHGLSFSSLDKKIPGSLLNIFKCLVKQKFIKKIPKRPDLTIWAKRGVLLLNSALTTIDSKRNSHQKIWSIYTDIVIKNLCNYFQKKNRTLIFMLWGDNARKKSYIINLNSYDSGSDDSDNNNHIVLEYRHPSPQAQFCEDKLKFINCPHFKEVNEILKSEYKDGRATMPKMSWKLKKKKTVIYTDGSAYPNKDISSAKNGYSCIFTDGVLEKLAIYGSSEKFVLHPLSNKKMCSTSTRAEGTAICKALAKCNTLSYDKWDEIEIVTDSKHWMDMLLIWMPNWIKNDIDFDIKKVPDITKEMWKEWNELNKKGHVIIRHINSHKKIESAENSQEEYDIQNNDIADQLANKARLELDYGEYIEDDSIFE